MGEALFPYINSNCFHDKIIIALLTKGGGDSFPPFSSKILN